MPKSVKLMVKSMINEDGTKYRRLRSLVHKAFTPRRLDPLEGRIERLTTELLDKIDTRTTVAAKFENQIDLMQAYSLPIPVTVIAEMVGVDPADVPSSLRT